MRPGTHGLVKVVFQLEPGAWHGYGTETVWAEKLGGNRYRLRNTPFYAFGVSAEDVVFAEPGDEGKPVFVGVSLRGGHSTYRIIRSEQSDSETFASSWEPLAKLGCSYEEGPGRLLAVDVPSKADIYRVYALLEHGENAGSWHFEEGHCGHALRDRSHG
jgi:hypothetical protein